MSPELPPPRLAGRLVLKALLGGVLILCLTSAAVASAVFLKVDAIGDEGFRVVPPAPFKRDVLDAPKPGEPQTLLLVGTDRRYGAAKGDARSDTMMLVRLDPKQEATAVLNVPRDLVVEIPGRGSAKINEAYALGGLSLVTETVKATLGVKISHAMAIDFKGFRNVVNTLNCIYTDVDRDYFNDRTGPGGYAAIDVDEGYQRLCGQRALDYVRYRHGDSDFVRAARQQTFLRDAKDQVGTSALIEKADDLIKVFGRATQADPSLQKNKQVQRLLEQGVLSAGKPVRQIRFPGTIELDETEGGLGSYVTATPYDLEQTRLAFLAATKEKQRLVRPQVVKDGAQRAARGKKTTLADFGLVDAKTQGENVIVPLEAKSTLDFPIYFPQGLTRRGRWTGSPPEPRTYKLRDRGDKEHDAYRLVFTQDEVNGDYYGVQGTTWKSPPILAGSSEGLRMRGSRLPLALRWQEAAHRRVADEIGDVLGLQHAGARADEHRDARHRALAHPGRRLAALRSRMAVYQPDQAPPRLAFGLYKRFLLAAVVIVMATTAAVATAALLEVKDAADIFDRFSEPIAGIDAPNVLDDVDPGGPQTIVVLGSDRRYVDIKAKTPTRSDTIILVRLDPDRGATAVMSLPRDLRVEVPGYPGKRKINEAYALGGPKLAVQTVKQLLGGEAFPVSHVVNVNFGGFQRAVNRLGCVYADIDRRYFNDNTGPEPDYAVIDVPAGYQRLCGKAALEYVRYRHNDNDIVRGARQQDFLRQAKAQIGVSRLFSDRDKLIEIFGRYTQTDLNSFNAKLRLLKLVFESAKNPIQEVQIKGLEESGADLVASPASIQRAAQEFLTAQASEGPRDDPSDDAATKARAKRSAKQKRGGLPAGLIEARRAAEDQAVPLDTKLDFPVYFPKLAVTGSTLRERDHRAYDLYDRGRRRYRAYRMVVNVPGTGQNYGIQGTNWKAPPILDSPSETRKVGGRRFDLFYDGDRLRLVAWRTGKAVYWVSNTLLQTLTERQMLGLAGGLTRVGGK